MCVGGGGVRIRGGKGVVALATPYKHEYVGAMTIKYKHEYMYVGPLQPYTKRE